MTGEVRGEGGRGPDEVSHHSQLTIHYSPKQLGEASAFLLLKEKVARLGRTDEVLNAAHLHNAQSIKGSVLQRVLFPVYLLVKRNTQHQKQGLRAVGNHGKAVGNRST
jgi:hypothetical protein